MLKKAFAIVSVVCVVIASIASTSFASPIFDDDSAGVWHAYNGSYWYDQGHVYVYGDPDDDYYIFVGVAYNTVPTGWKRSTVGAGNQATCTSEQVQNSGGNVCYYPKIK